VEVQSAHDAGLIPLLESGRYPKSQRRNVGCIDADRQKSHPTQLRAAPWIGRIAPPLPLRGQEIAFRSRLILAKTIDTFFLSWSKSTWGIVTCHDLPVDIGRKGDSSICASFRTQPRSSFEHISFVTTNLVGPPQMSITKQLLHYDGRTTSLRFSSTSSWN